MRAAVVNIVDGHMKMQSHCHCLIVFLIVWSVSLPGAFAEEPELPLPAEPKHGRPYLMPEAERQRIRGLNGIAVFEEHVSERRIGSSQAGGMR